MVKQGLTAMTRAVAPAAASTSIARPSAPASTAPPARDTDPRGGTPAGLRYPSLGYPPAHGTPGPRARKVALTPDRFSGGRPECIRQSSLVLHSGDKELIAAVWESRLSVERVAALAVLPKPDRSAAIKAALS